MLFIPFAGYGQFENIRPVTVTDTLSEAITTTDTTVVVVYKIKYTHTYYKDYITQRIDRLAQDSVEIVREKERMSQQAINDMKAVRTEKRRLTRFLQR